MLDPSSPWGYETRHAVLHGTGRYVDAIDTFETMLSKMVQSPDPKIRGELHLRCRVKDDSPTLPYRASWPVHQPIQHPSGDPQNCSTNYTSFATRAH